MAPTRFAGHSYDGEGASGAHGVKWNAISLVGRQGLIMIFSLVLARLLGPGAYGVIAQASIYISLTTLILDQGLTAALVSRRSVSREAAAAASTVNVVLGISVAVVTILIARALADFFRTPSLQPVLWVLGAALILKALAIVPRMLLTRSMSFRAIAISDVGGALIGGLAGIIGALSGLDYWALVLQLVLSDCFAAVVLVVSARPPWPGLRFSAIRGDASFSGRVFVGNLVSFSSRNVDNILIGRVFGANDLAYYSLSYRVLLTPVQMIGQVVTRVLFPAISRVRDDLTAVQTLIVRSTGTISSIAFPLMGFVAVSAVESVNVFLGAEWAPAIVVLQVLAVTGARQAVTAINAPVLLGLGLSKVHLRFNLVAAFVQIAGMILGLPWGIYGVAVGYTVAGIMLTPIIFWLQSKYAALSWARQIASFVPPLVGTLMAVLVYLLTDLLPLSDAGRLIIGGVLSGSIYILTMRLFFSKFFDEVFKEIQSVLRSRN